MTLLLAAIGILILAYAFFFLENRHFVTCRTVIPHQKVQNRFTIVQVSDLHDARFGKDQKTLLASIRECCPDMIVVTGDLFNRRNRKAYRNALCFAENAVKISPVYFVEGNHECALEEVGKQNIEAIRKLGVHVLYNESVDYGSVRLIGLKQFASKEDLSDLLDRNRLNVVLAHRPELFPKYAETDADVILSGHAHGGQIRMFGVGMYAPQQGLFPKYTSGLYEKNGTKMFVSRGLGNTIPFPRVFNTPELNRLDFISMEEGAEPCSQTQLKP